MPGASSGLKVMAPPGKTTVLATRYKVRGALGPVNSAAAQATHTKVHTWVYCAALEAVGVWEPN